MEITEATAVVRARAFIKRCEITSIPVDVPGALQPQTQKSVIAKTCGQAKPETLFF